MNFKLTRLFTGTLLATNALFAQFVPPESNSTVMVNSDNELVAPTATELKAANPELNQIEWGNLTGVLTNQTDLSNALLEKLSTSNIKPLSIGEGLTGDDYNVVNGTTLSVDTTWLVAYYHRPLYASRGIEYANDDFAYDGRAQRFLQIDTTWATEFSNKLYRDFFIFVDMRMSPNMKGLTKLWPEVNNKFYYKDENGAVKQTVNKEGEPMPRYVDIDSYYGMTAWTDFELKVIDKYGNNIYFSSTIALNNTEVMNGHSQIIDSTPKIYYLSTQDSNEENKCYGTKTPFTDFDSSIGATVPSTYIVSGVWLYPSIDSTETRTVPIYTGYNITSGNETVVWGEYLREIFTDPDNLIIVWRQTPTMGETDAPSRYVQGNKRWIVVEPTFYGDFKLKD